MARAVIDGGTSAGASVGRSDVDLVTTFAKSPGDMNAAFGSGYLVSSTVRGEATFLYGLGNQLGLVVDMSAYPLYALSSQFQTDLQSVVAALAGTGPYNELMVTLHDGVDGGTYGYQGSSTKAYMPAPTVAVPGGSPGAYTLTISYPSSGTGIYPGVPIPQTGDSIYLDEVVGVTALASGYNGAGLPTATTLVTSGSNGVDPNTFTGSGVLYVADASLFASAGTVCHIDYTYGCAVITYTNKTATTLTGCTTTILTGTSPGLNSFTTGDLIWNVTSPPIPAPLTGAFTVTGTPTTTAGITTFTVSTGSVPVIALTPSVQVPGAQPTFGGQLKMDSAAAIAHGDPAQVYTSTSYLTALLSNFSTLRTNLQTQFATSTGGIGRFTVGLGLTSTNWTSSTVTLPSSITAAAAAGDFVGVNSSVPMASWSSGVQSLRWALAQAHGLSPGGQTAVSWFDLYDPAMPLYHDPAHYTNLTSYFYNVLTSVFTDDSMSTLTGNGLRAWNWLNDDYLNTADYGTSYPYLVWATDRYAQKQHFLGASLISAQASILASVSKGLAAQARISTGTGTTLPAGSRVQTSVSVALAAGANLVLFRSVPLVAGARVQAVTSVPLVAGAHVAITNTTTIAAGGAIVHTSSVPLSAGARVQASTSANIAAGARVSNKGTATIVAGGSIVQTASAFLSAGARVQTSRGNTLAAGATVSRTVLNTLAAGAYMAITGLAPLTAGARILATTHQTLAAGAQIVPRDTIHKSLVAGGQIRGTASSTIAAGAYILGPAGPEPFVAQARAGIVFAGPARGGIVFVSPTRS